MTNLESESKFLRAERQPKTKAELTASHQEEVGALDRYLALVDTGKLKRRDENGKIWIYKLKDDGSEEVLFFIDKEALDEI